MTGYVIRRVLWMIPLLWAVATITFFLMQAIPGGPFDREKPAPPQVRQNLERKYNLDRPIHVQYVSYMRALARGDLGVSFRNNRDVSDIIRSGLWVSAQLGLTAFVFAVVFGMTLGTMSALNQNRLLDYVGVLFATAGAALPSFILATLLIMVFSVQLGWFDVLGWEFGNYRKMVLPVLSLGVLPAAFVARVTRVAVLDVLHQDYIRTARAKGLRERRILLRHTLKNALIPVLTIAGPLFATLITGSVIVERIFQINGIGRPFVDAVFIRDYGVIMGTTLLFAAIVVIANLVVDLLYAYVDPRIRY
jgi:oligopeptide transport system permease protein